MSSNTFTAQLKTQKRSRTNLSLVIISALARKKMDAPAEVTKTLKKTIFASKAVVVLTSASMPSWAVYVMAHRNKKNNPASARVSNVIVLSAAGVSSLTTHQSLVPCQSRCPIGSKSRWATASTISAGTSASVYSQRHPCWCRDVLVFLLLRLFLKIVL